MPAKTTSNQGRKYTKRNLREIAFPLGGIGTGTVSLTGNGGLAEWQIHNRPDQDTANPNTFFAIWAKEVDADPVTRVLEGPVPAPYNRHQFSVNGSLNQGVGLHNSLVPGLPRVDGVTFRGEYPIAHLDYADANLPVQVSLEALNPFIPMNPDDSGIPCAIFNFTVTNPGPKPVDLTLALNMRNLTPPTEKGGCINELFREGGTTGVLMGNHKRSKSDPQNGTACIATPWKHVTHRAAWLRLGWFDMLQQWWDEFSATGKLKPNAYSKTAGRRDSASFSQPADQDTATIGLRATLQPGETQVLPIWITWSFPIFEKHWAECDSEGCGCASEKPTWKNYYAKKFPNARKVVAYLKANSERLEADTRSFRDSLFGSSLPEEVLDAVSSQISIMRSPTCIRLPDGTFYGFEGCSCTNGCCTGSCTHVWNYQQAVPFLFPSLERSVREADYACNFFESDSGGMQFRIDIPLKRTAVSANMGMPDAVVGRAAADGQLGGIVRTYRDWKISGDSRWLRKLWPSVKKSLEYAWKYWDYKKRGVADGLQHNTYDISFFGPNTLTGSIYMAALKAGEEMALALGETESAEEYRKLREKGARWMDKHLFNGSFYIQKVRNDAWQHSECPEEEPVRVIPAMKPGEPRYQYGPGCLSDQLLGQTIAHVAGLGYVLEEKNVRKAVRAIYRHNFKSKLEGHVCCQRVYALQDEAGLLLCTWPNGGRPALPFPYSDEVWTGIEYQVAAHLAYEGYTREALNIVRGVRKRHDGIRRNPWNEFECGSYYARAMASYALLTAWSGFRYDGTTGMIGFAPVADVDNFTTFWSAQKAWGSYTQKGKKRRKLEVKFGSMKLHRLGAGLTGRKPKVTLNGKSIEATVENGDIVLSTPLKLTAGDVVETE